MDKKVTLEKIEEDDGDGFMLCFSMGYSLFIPDKEGLEVIYKEDE